MGTLLGRLLPTDALLRSVDQPSVSMRGRGTGSQWPRPSECATTFNIVGTRFLFDFRIYSTLDTCEVCEIYVIILHCRSTAAPTLTDTAICESAVNTLVHPSANLPSTLHSFKFKSSLPSF